MHLRADPAAEGHFNVLRGSIAPLGLAGVKVVGDFVDNYQLGLPSEMALLNLFDPRDRHAQRDRSTRPRSPTCAPARSPRSARGTSRASDARVLGHIGARGTAYWNVRLLDRLFDFDEIRVHSRRPESRDAFADGSRDDLGKPVVATADWE